MATHSIPSVQLCLNNVSENQLPPLQCHFMIFSCIFTFGLLLAVCLAGLALHFTISAFTRESVGLGHFCRYSKSWTCAAAQPDGFFMVFPDFGSCDVLKILVANIQQGLDSD